MTLAKSFDVVLIDGGADVEQINSRVMKNVDYLLIVTDTSAKGVNVASTIRHVARIRGLWSMRSLGLWYKLAS